MSGLATGRRDDRGAAARVWLFVPVMAVAAMAGLARGAPWPGLGFLAIAAGWQIVRARAADRHGIGFEASDAQDARLMQVVGLAMVPLPALHVATGFPWFGTYPLPSLAAAAGLALGTGGVALLASAHVALGRLWSPTTRLRSRHHLIKDGVFARIRHPMYAAFFLIAGSQALLVGNWMAGPAGLVAFTALYRRRLPREEAMMYHAFGPEWAYYAARTQRLVPRLTRRRS